MKGTLKRIQETLDQLETLKQSTTEPHAISDRPISFQISPGAPKTDLPPPPASKSDRLQLPQLLPSGSVELSPVGETPVERSPEAKSIEQVLQQIQALYHEGPIVDGWIDSFPTVLEPDDKVEEIVFERPGLTTAAFSEPDTSVLTSYRVCGIDAFGESWSYPCPSDQLLELSVAIARYHKLQELLAQKRQL